MDPADAIHLPLPPRPRLAWLVVLVLACAPGLSIAGASAHDPVAGVAAEPANTMDSLAMLPGALIASLALGFALRERSAARRTREELDELIDAHRDLSERERHYRSLAEGLGAGLWQLDPQGRTVYLNPAMRALVGADGREEADEAAPGPMLNLRTPAAAARDGAHVYEATVRGQPQRALLVCEAPLRDAGGELLGTLRVCTELAEAGAWRAGQARALAAAAAQAPAARLH